MSIELPPWMLPSLEEESELASPREDRRSRTASACCTMTRSPPAGQSMQHLRSVGESDSTSEAAMTSNCCLGLMGDPRCPWPLRRPKRLRRAVAPLPPPLPPSTTSGWIVTPRLWVKDSDCFPWWIESIR